MKTKTFHAAALVMTSVLWAVLLAPPFQALAGTDAAETYFRPWSGYWWSTRSGALANGYANFGHPAPTEKFELLTTGTYPGATTQWELANHYDPDAESWNGQCHAWAAAAAYENIVFYPSSYNNIIFRVGDKKGLLSACHGSDLTISESVRYNPEIFHAWLLNYIKVHRRAFVANLGSATEAWFYPIFQYDMQLTNTSAGKEVRCQIWYADDNVHPDIQGTVVKTKIYTYLLYLNARNEITGGEWTGTSAGSPPRSVFYPLAPQATNPFLNYELIRSISLHKDDFLENTGAVQLTPGNYNLILLNEDAYTINAGSGDRLAFGFEKIDTLEDGIRIDLLDAAGRMVWQAELNDTATLTLAAENPPYRLNVRRDNYGGGGIYRIVFDQSKANEQWIPDLQKGSAWNGVAITNTFDLPLTDVQIVAYDSASRPVATLKGPYEIGPRQKDVWLAESLPMRLHEKASIKALKLLCDDPAAMISLDGIGRQSLAGFGQPGGSGAGRWMIPDTSGLFSTSKVVTWGLVNRFAQAVELNCLLYSAQGIPERQAGIHLPAGSVLRYSPSANPFYKAIENGWIDVQTSVPDTAAGVDGFSRWLKNDSGGPDSLFALTRTDTRMIIPHVAVSGVWRTEMTLINPGGAVNAVECRMVNGQGGEPVPLELMPYEKTTRSIVDLFPAMTEEELAQGALQITAQTPVAGYFTYKTAVSSAAFELMALDQGVNQLAIPHIARDGDWWTGVALYNPGPMGVAVTLTPMGRNGEMVPGEEVVLTVAPFTKAVFNLGEVFPETRLPELPWVRITADGNGIMGLFLYGDGSLGLLSGAELYR